VAPHVNRRQDGADAPRVYPITFRERLTYRLRSATANAVETRARMPASDKPHVRMIPAGILKPG